jgi:hypothetical protein
LTLLEENASPPLDPESPKINYDDFMQVVQKASPAIAYVLIKFILIFK